MCMEGFMFGSCCVHDDKKKKPGHHGQSGGDNNYLDGAIDKIDTGDDDIATTEDSKDKWTLIQTAGTAESATNRPTRPSRPTKPMIKWPPPQSLREKPKKDTLFPNKKPTDQAKTKKPILSMKRPTKRPPSVKPPRTPTSWVWDHTEKSYFPSVSDSSEETTSSHNFFPAVSTELNEIKDDDLVTEWTSLKVRPTRPTRPPKPSKVMTYFPSTTTSTEKKLFVFQRTTALTTTTSSTTTTTRTTTRRTTTTRTTTTRATTTTTKTTTSKPLFVPVSTKATSRPGRKPETINVGKGKMCGIPQVKGSCSKGRIVNGTQSCYGQFPWQVRNVSLKMFITVFLTHLAPAG